MSANRPKLNADKTELMGWVMSWSGSVYILGSAGPSLRLGTEMVAASDQVRVLGVTMFVRHASTGFVSSDGFDVHSTLSLQLHWSTRDVMRGLLQRHSRWSIQVYHRQAPASYL